MKRSQTTITQPETFPSGKHILKSVRCSTCGRTWSFDSQLSRWWEDPEHPGDEHPCVNAGHKVTIS